VCVGVCIYMSERESGRELFVKYTCAVGNHGHLLSNFSTFSYSVCVTLTQPCVRLTVFTKYILLVLLLRFYAKILF
jgi:hypothetical protein